MNCSAMASTTQQKDQDENVLAMASTFYGTNVSASWLTTDVVKKAIWEKNLSLHNALYGLVHCLWQIMKLLLVM